MNLRAVMALCCGLTALLCGFQAKAQWTAADVATTRMDAKSFTSKGAPPVRVEYLLYLPNGYQTNPVARWPLMLYLHGAGERSTNVFGVTWHGPPKLVRQGYKFPMLIIAPLCPPKKWWNDAVLLELLNHAEREYRVDTNRVYLTGMSMGGSGTWSLGLTHADRFAAIAPICGNVKPTFLAKFTPKQIEAVQSLPVWAFHGAKDPLIPVAASERMTAALKDMGCEKVTFTKYPNADHDSWTITYSNPKFYQWLLKHSREKTTSF